MSSGICLIWKTPANVDMLNESFLAYESPRCGGHYRMSRSCVEAVESMNDSVRLCLTTWLIDQRRQGDEAPLINDRVLELLKTRKLLSVSQRIDRLLLWHQRNAKFSGELIQIFASDGFLKEDNVSLLAHTESLDKDYLHGLLLLALEGGLVSEIIKSFMLRPTVKGYDRLEALEKAGPDTAQAFVAMWFGAEMNDPYWKGIVPAIEEAGYTRFRVDHEEHNNKIDDEIIAGIRRSRFLVADFTAGFRGGEHIPRGGVYYEAGFAQGLGLPVIWTCREDCIDHVHFDTRQYNHIVWNDPADLKKRLRNRILAVIGEGPGKA